LLYEKSKRQAAELEAASRLQADFMAMIVHDLRTPLSNIVSIAQVMKDGLFGPINDEQSKWLEKMSTNGNGLIGMIGDFLDLSKLEAGRIELKRETFDLKKVLNAALENFKPAAVQKQIRLRASLVEPILPIEADPRRLDQVMNNLLSNALKFTPPGGEIEMGASNDGAEAKVWVKDSGIGIAQGEGETLFEKYQQGAGGKMSAQKGTGLGLVICKMIVEAHGGKISVASAMGKGAVFTFTIPAERSETRMAMQEQDQLGAVV
jgi:signal transduction histidine kinase